MNLYLFWWIYLPFQNLTWNLSLEIAAKTIYACKTFEWIFWINSLYVEHRFIRQIEFKYGQQELQFKSNTSATYKVPWAVRRKAKGTTLL